MFDKLLSGFFEFVQLTLTTILLKEYSYKKRGEDNDKNIISWFCKYN